ncbi:MAG: hypothetical protein AAGA77_09655 [Bacteroidota bacterium]
MRDSKLANYLEWIRNDNSNFREVSNVLELHYFLLGYQISESDNIVLNGEGNWIGDFMTFCELELTRELQMQEGLENVALGSNYAIYIHNNSESNESGLQKIFQLLDKFWSSAC